MQRNAGVFLLLLSTLASGALRAATEQDALLLLSNPVSGVTRVHAQFNTDYHLGEDRNGSRRSLTLRPVIPIPLTGRWQLVSHTELSFISQDEVTETADTERGIGNLHETVLFAPRSTGPQGFAWGAGLAARIDTASVEGLPVEGSAFGPAVVLTQTDGRLVSGLTASHVWGSGASAADVSHLEAFSTWSRDGRGFSLYLQAAYDSTSREMTMPASVKLSRVLRAGSLFLDLGARARYYVDVPDNRGRWGFGLDIALLRDFEVP